MSNPCANPGCYSPRKKRPLLKTLCDYDYSQKRKPFLEDLVKATRLNTPLAASRVHSNSSALTGAGTLYAVVKLKLTARETEVDMPIRFLG